MAKPIKGRKVEFGDKCRDLVTGIVGIAVAKTEWLNGCIRWSLDFPKDGEVKRETFDDEQLEVIEANVVPRPERLARIADYLPREAARPGGAGRTDPPRHANPSR